jgi:hypothetical protein
MANYPKPPKRQGSKPTPRSNNGKRTNHNSGVRKALKDQRRMDAEDRAAEYAKLSDVTKLGDLDNALGKGIGAANERARLQKRIEAAKAAVAEAKKK